MTWLKTFRQLISHPDASLSLMRNTGDAMVVASLQIESELARDPLLHLKFPQSLEANLERERKSARVQNIRLTIAMGLVAYDVPSLVDGTILPDLGWFPLFWRFGIVTPLALLAVWQCAKVSPAIREAYLAAIMTCALLGPVGFILTSHAPLAPYTMLVVVLVLMFGNITIRLRFDWAVFFTAISLTTVLGMLELKQGQPTGLSILFVIAILSGCSFGLVANNQLERGERRSFLLSCRDALMASQLMKEKESLTALSRVDSLTELANRRVFDLRLLELWKLREESGQHFSLMMIDVDFFKRYNDLYGHPKGDECLQLVAAALRKVVVHEHDLIVRYGGEEFAVLLADCRETGALKMAGRLCLAVRQAAILHGNREDTAETVSVSIGVASSELHATSPEAVVSVADQNLYRAKSLGRDRVFPGIHALS